MYPRDYSRRAYVQCHPAGDRGTFHAMESAGLCLMVRRAPIQGTDELVAPFSKSVWITAMSPTIVERDRTTWSLPTTEAMEKNRKWAIGLTDGGMGPRPFWPHRNGDRGQWHPRSFERHRIAQLSDCVGADVEPLERSTMDSDKLSGPECAETILTRNPYHSTDSNSMFSSEFKMMLSKCSTTGSSGLTVPGRKSETTRCGSSDYPAPTSDLRRA